MTRKDEFSSIIGESQSSGSRGVLGLPPEPPSEARVSDGAAPTYERQIVSGYDSRPIGAFDGFLNCSILYYNGLGIETELRPAITPPGYITVIRQVQYEVENGFMALLRFNWRVRIGGITQPNWIWTVGKEQASIRSVPTFIVVPPKTEVILVPDFPPSDLTPLLNLPVFFFNLHCNFILDANEPPTEQIATMPPTVRIGESPERYK